MKLTKQQNAIGNILQEGSHLVAEGLLTEEEEKQVEHEMTLVNARWEELRLQAMERQTRQVTCIILRLLVSLRGSLGTYGLTQKLC